MINLINNTHKGKILNQFSCDSYRFQIPITQLWAGNPHQNRKQTKVNCFVKVKKNQSTCYAQVPSIQVLSLSFG